MNSLLTWGCGVLLLLAIGLGVATWGQSKRIDVLNAQNAGLRASLSQAASANADQAKTIDTLTTANEDWASKAQVQHREHAQTLLDLARANVAREKARDALRAREAQDQGSVACQTLLHIDLAKVCPNIAEAAKERAK